MISPPAFVWAIAVLNERHGEATVHELTSLPVDDTAERAFCANAPPEMRMQTANVRTGPFLDIFVPLCA